jgi:serine/threonine-protein kinase RsbW/stage II sporulation protein AB (anti-sigma F factor)
MDEMSPSRWSAPATPFEVGRLRRAATANAAERGLNGRALDHLTLAVSEALTNAVLHAYPADVPPGPVQLEVAGDNGGIRVTVADRGGGMSVRSGGRGLGLGLGILASVSDFCEICSVRGEGMRVSVGFGFRTGCSKPTPA